MTENNFTPPPELVQWWMTEYRETKADCLGTEFIATRAAQWGADQELKACCKWQELHLLAGINLSKQLRNARRPKPPSLKEQALDELHISFDRGYLKGEAADTIRRALEQLPE